MKATVRDRPTLQVAYFTGINERLSLIDDLYGPNLCRRGIGGLAAMNLAAVDMEDPEESSDSDDDT